MDPTRISFNQATAETSDTVDVLRACRQAGLGQVSLWRHRYVDQNVVRTRRLVDEHDLSVSSLCRGGFFTGTRSDREAFDDNRAAIEEAAVLGAPVLVLVCGPLVGTSLATAERRIVSGIQQLLPTARAAGIALAVEPFHPMLITERSAVVSLAQANRLVEEIGEPDVGIAVDTYHVWWDPQLSTELVRARGRILAVHVADWLTPTTSLTAGRGLPGDGVIPLTTIIGQICAGGYAGPLEVEVLNPDVWSRPVGDLAADVRRRMLHLFPGDPAGADSTITGRAQPG